MAQDSEKDTADIPGMTVFVPLHMKGAEEIASVFSVKRETVVQWAKDGAPIAIVGKRYQANYAELWEWIKKNT